MGTKVHNTHRIVAVRIIAGAKLAKKFRIFQAWVGIRSGDQPLRRCIRFGGVPNANPTAVSRLAMLPEQICPRANPPVLTHCLRKGASRQLERQTGVLFHLQAEGVAAAAAQFGLQQSPKAQAQTQHQAC